MPCLNHQVVYLPSSVLYILLLMPPDVGIAVCPVYNAASHTVCPVSDAAGVLYAPFPMPTGIL